MKNDKEFHVPLSLQVAGKSDRGLVRQGNEDSLSIDKRNNVYAVCDGMGGHQAGEVASRLAVETIEAAFNAFAREMLSDPGLALGRTLPAQAELLVKAIRLANRAIHNAARADTGKAGMGTTVVATAFEADIMSVAHVGDSRAYKLLPDRLQPLTEDHSWVAEIQHTQNLSKEEADNLVGKNIITRALGVKELVEVDLSIVKVRPGDTFILCSDGLCGYADDDEIFQVAHAANDDINRITGDLIQMANDRGGMDNVTVITIRVAHAEDSPLPDLEKITLPGESANLLSHEDEWLQKLAEAKKKASDDTETVALAADNKANPLLLIGIFAAFIIIAAAIIYLTQRPH
ncbi:MAG: Stp1/IreP family PP2C-type Ser/Thr phosphatase [candidate division Zixibacteria bacterium]|jgi:protein phosphatase|nr:Stp1/IreP family PP2C-type Ser/Thr phosphatase [candidate division Zixibacteria bacterium]